jgi:zinc protease
MAGGHKAEEAEKLIYQEIARLQEEVVSARELEKTKNSVEAFFVRILKTNQYKAFMLGFYHTQLGDYREMFREIDRYRTVQATDIKRVARQFLNPSNRTVIVARPGK